MIEEKGKGDLKGDPSGLPDRKVVKEAQKNFSMNARFWALIKLHRIPYKIVDGKLVEAGYTESAKSVKELPYQSKIHWLTDEEISAIEQFPQTREQVLKTAEGLKWTLEIFKTDLDKKKG